MSCRKGGSGICWAEFTRKGPAASVSFGRDGTENSVSSAESKFSGANFMVQPSKREEEDVAAFGD
jgi:hypothetical protein